MFTFRRCLIEYKLFPTKIATQRTMLLNNERNSSVSSSGSSTTSPTEKKNADFSISAILSDETGGRKARGTPVSIRERRASAGMVLSPPGMLVCLFIAHIHVQDL